ncbi:early nodulin-like protein 17 [Rutidosis leptorrhynchoides]|uniref:early nodulin-like protein 17 n=1 Tax=Rutidosis leptorrhynchoides TaxID=125765 RepID=UPI003A98E0EF
MNGSSRLSAVVAIAFCATLMVMVPEVSGKRLIVGGSMGWTSNVNYTLWAGNQTFYLGDWLFFVYDRNQNDIIEVNKTNYETCIAEHPIHNYTTGAGRDVVELNVTRERYFISSKGSCYGGMKLLVHLTPTPPPPRAAPLKSHSSRFTVLRSQFVIPAVFAIAAIWDSLLLRV